MKVYTLLFAALVSGCVSPNEAGGDLEMIVIPRGEVPPSSMEFVRGALSIEPDGCVMVTEGATRHLLAFPEPSSISTQGGQRTIKSLRSTLIDGRTYRITGSTMGPLSSQMQSRFGLTSDCDADQVFLFNGTIEN